MAFSTRELSLVEILDCESLVTGEISLVEILPVWHLESELVLVDLGNQ